VIPHFMIAGTISAFGLLVAQLLWQKQQWPFWPYKTDYVQTELPGATDELEPIADVIEVGGPGGTIGVVVLGSRESATTYRQQRWQRHPWSRWEAGSWIPEMKSVTWRIEQISGRGTLTHLKHGFIEQTSLDLTPTQARKVFSWAFWCQMSTDPTLQEMFAEEERTSWVEMKEMVKKDLEARRKAGGP